MKKLVSLLLGLMMIFMVSAAMAETVTVNPGDTLELEVTLSSASGNGAEIGIETNDAPVTFVDAVGGSVNDTVPPRAFNDYFVVVNIDRVGIQPDGTGLTGSLTDYTLSTLEDGHVGTLTFQVDTDAEEGTYTVSVYKKSGSCTVNGSVTFEIVAASDRLPGDADDNGVVDWPDLILMLKYVSDWDVTINTSNADVTADGMVYWDDMILILKYISGWDVELK